MEGEIGMANTKTGWERHKRTHFDEIVVNYDNIRPGYPPELIADVVRYAGRDKGNAALEIGPGTGKATAPFLDAGYAVTAVEIGANMADFLVNRFGSYQDFRVIVSSFEDVSLKEDTYDLLYAASAFHWVDPKIGCPKIHRLLKNGGAVALLRYNFFPDDDDPLYEEIQRIYDRYYRSYYPYSVRPTRKSDEEWSSPTQIRIGFGFESLEAYGFCDVQMKLHPVVKTYTPDEYIALLDTLADHRGLPEENRTAMYAAIRSAIESHGGAYTACDVFQAYMGRKTEATQNGGTASSEK